MDHLQACMYCPKSDMTCDGEVHCTIYANRSWVNRVGGCGMFPFRELPPGLSYIDGRIAGRGRIGQQKQKHEDRKYHSKNDGKRKYKYNI